MLFVVVRLCPDCPTPITMSTSQRVSNGAQATGVTVQVLSTTVGGGGLVLSEVRISLMHTRLNLSVSSLHFSTHTNTR